ncbi:hypothetical protein D1007_02788 [Hordeum vulgare]|nr:hypothetical protein D1007_02788 [Hordeum vulgare]
MLPAVVGVDEVIGEDDGDAGDELVLDEDEGRGWEEKMCSLLKLDTRVLPSFRISSYQRILEAMDSPLRDSEGSIGGSTLVQSQATAGNPISQFAPLFTSSTPAASPPPPRHPIFNDHITNHIKFLLNPADHNYHKWKSFFLMVLVRYGVSYLIEHPPPPNADTQYRELDAHVALWIYATLADPLIDHVVGATTTYVVWTKIKDYFLANRAARFMLLNRQYRNLKQGNLSVTEYARRLKLLTDGLADIDYAITEVDLTTQFLHDLDKRLDTIRDVLGDQGLPFDTVLSRVVLAKESMTHRAAEESASAFALPGAGSSTNIASGSGGRSIGDRVPDRGSDRPPLHHPHPPQQQRGRGDGGDHGRGRGDGGGRGRHDSGGRAPPSHPTAAPFMGYFAPYGMAIPPPRPGWVPPNSAGVLGPRPGSHAHAYPVLHSTPTPPYFPTQQPSWDHLAMLNAAYSSGGVKLQIDLAIRCIGNQQRAGDAGLQQGFHEAAEKMRRSCEGRGAACCCCLLELIKRKRRLAVVAAAAVGGRRIVAGAAASADWKGTARQKQEIS